MFEAGSLYWSNDGIIIRELHPKSNGPPTPPIMRTLPFLEGRELRISAPLPNTTKGRDVAESMKGELPLYGGLSVEFRAERESRRNGLRVIARAYLDGAALVEKGAYADALVEVRSESGLILPRAETLWL